ncbi:MAG: PAS domain S-box protein [Bacteroidales bacterium]|jgi:PAS domain S-box-containing protein
MVKILAIDDRNDNLISLKAIIKDAFPDYIVLMALSGQEGIEIAITENPDVILLDIFMPVMDGFEVCQRLKHDERISDIPVIFLTAAKGDKESRIKALEAGAEAFLTKPIDETELTAQIRAMVKIKAANQIKRYEKARLEEIVNERTKKLELSQIATLNALNDLMAENNARRKTEIALRESEERFIHLFERAPLGYQSLDENGVFIEVNQAWLDTLGYAKKEVIGKWFGDFVAPEFVCAFKERFPIFKTQGFIHSEFEMLHKDGKRRFISFDGRIGHKHDGSFEKTHCIVQDITDKKKIERELSEREAQFRRMFDQAPIGAAMVSLDYKYMMVNDALCKITGYSSEELISRTFSSITHPDDIAFETEQFEKIMSGETDHFEMEKRYIRTDGSIVWVNLNVRAINDEEKRICHFLPMMVDISARKEAEEGLSQSYQRYQLLFNEMLDGFALHEIICNEQGGPVDYRFLAVNPAFEKQTGLKASQIVGKTVLEVLPTTELHWIERYGNVALTGEPAIFEDYSIALDKFFDVKTFRPAPKQFVSIFSDITERKRVEETIRHNALRLERMVNIYQYSSNNIQDILDYTLNEAIELTASKIGYIYFYDEEKKQFELNSWSKDVMHECAVTNPKVCYELNETGIWGEVVRQRKELIINNFQEHNPLKKGYPKGHVKLERFLTIPIFDDDKIVAVVGVANKESDYDNTDLNQLRIMMNSVWRIVKRKEVEQNIKLMAHALESIGECVSITDTNDVLLYVNEAFTRTYGYSENEIIGKHIGLLRPEEADTSYNTDILNQTISGGWKGEVINTKKDGTNFPILLSTSVIKDENKKPAALIGVARDISELKKQNEELLSAKRKAEESDHLKTSFLHNISHEIRTPMNAIVGFAELLNDPDLLPEDSKCYTDIIVRSSNQLLSIITDIVNIATIEAGQEKIVERVVNVNSICRLVYEQFQLKAEKQNIDLKYLTSIADCNSRILTDETKLIQILTNLISNAIKFTKEGSVHFGCELKNDNLEFSVKDSGIGIPLDKQDDIFKRFRQLDHTENRQFGGSGLGLSISKTYVELLGGRMWVESEPDKGSSFFFTIPYKEAISLTH